MFWFADVPGFGGGFAGGPVVSGVHIEEEGVEFAWVDFSGGEDGVVGVGGFDVSEEDVVAGVFYGVGESAFHGDGAVVDHGCGLEFSVEGGEDV